MSALLLAASCANDNDISPGEFFLVMAPVLVAFICLVVFAAWFGR